MRSSTVLSLPLQLVFPALNTGTTNNKKGKFKILLDIKNGCENESLASFWQFHPRYVIIGYKLPQ